MLYEEQVSTTYPLGAWQRLTNWWEKPAVQLWAAPVVLTMLLVTLVGTYHEDVPLPLPPAPGAVIAGPYLEEGETLRLQTRYQGPMVELSVLPDSQFQGTMILVNDRQKLPQDYQPEDLVEVGTHVQLPAAADFRLTRASETLRIETVEALKQLLVAAYHEGVGSYRLVSALRDYDYQSGLYQRKVNQYRNMGFSLDTAQVEAARWVALPGASEHHTGYALDLPSAAHLQLTSSYLETRQGRWLKEHAIQHGFVVRYPSDKTDITGISYEPWHLRYVGLPHSLIMENQKWVLEEYHQALKLYGGLTYRDKSGSIWQVLYQEAKDQVLQVPEEHEYIVSGDGSKGYITTILLEKAK